jgi:beta-lactamase regulating signal transducer with metallopeptidase domain
MNAALAVVSGQGVSAAVVTWLGQALFLGTLLAGLTWILISLIHRRAHPSLVAILWSIVLLKFLIPFGPAAPFSLGSLWEQGFSFAQGGSAGDAASFWGGPDASRQAATAQALSSTAPAPQEWSWATSAALTYVALLITALVIRVRNYRVFLARCRSLPLADETVREWVRNVCRRLGVRRVPSVRVSSESRVPFVVGLIRPMLVLSHRQLARPAELETVIVHEVTHLRRGDMFVRYLQWIAGTLLFFWPVVSWVNRRIDEAREHACDVWALRHGSLSPGDYARCLLSVVQPLQVRCCGYRPACMAASPSMIERRIDMILDLPSNERRRPIWGLLMCTLIIAWGAFALAGPVGADRDIDPDEGVVTDEQLSTYLGEIAARMSEFPGTDVDGNGELDRVERNAFTMVGVKMIGSSVVIEAYPYADQDGDGSLTFDEAYDLVRGHVLLMKNKKQFGQIFQEEKTNGTLTEEREEDLKKEIHLANNAVYVDVLDMYGWVMDNVPSQPPAEGIEKTRQMIFDYEAKMKAGEKGLQKGQTKAEYIKQDIQKLKQKAAELRQKAEQTDDPDMADKLHNKADKIEGKVDHLHKMLQEMEG